MCQECFLRGKGGQCIRLTTSPPSCTSCLEIWEPQPLGALRACTGIAVCFPFNCLNSKVATIFSNDHYTFAVIIVGLKLLHLQHLWLCDYHWRAWTLHLCCIFFCCLIFDISDSEVLCCRCVNRLVGKSCMINRLHDSQNCSVICTRLSITNKIQFINKQFIKK